MGRSLVQLLVIRCASLVGRLLARFELDHVGVDFTGALRLFALEVLVCALAVARVIDLVLSQRRVF